MLDPPLNSNLSLPVLLMANAESRHAWSWSCSFVQFSSWYIRVYLDYGDRNKVDCTWKRGAWMTSVKKR